MTKPVLVVMAAGMGSRYGGPKQIDPITEQGEIIIDFSLYDAMLAGFEEAVFIIKKEIEADIRARIENGAGRHLKTTFVLQELSDLPKGYRVPDGRLKPWGTCHAILSAREAVSGNFAVINADDYYGPGAYRLVYDALEKTKDGKQYDYTLVGYRLSNTLSEYGSVARGVCVLDENGQLAGVDERLKILRRDGAVQYQEADDSWQTLSEDATVSMNLWGFSPSLFKEIEAGFPAFLDAALKTDPLKAEYLLPRKIDELLRTGRAAVKVLKTDERWFGVTNPEDKEHVVSAVRAMKDKGLYPEQLW